MDQLEENWFFDFDETYVPIIYRSEVNIGFFGIEKYVKMHYFDSNKFEKIANALSKSIMKDKNFFRAKIATEEQLRTIHTKEYLKETLCNSLDVSIILQFKGLRYVPNSLLWYFVLNPMLYHVGATILGGELSMKFGWSICLSGGMHHASSNNGEGWCAFSDIPISIKNLMTKKVIKRAMIIDLDTHRGNGHATDKIEKKISENPEDIFIIDFYQPGYPFDEKSKYGINIGRKLTCEGNFGEDIIQLEEEDDYLICLKDALKDESIKEFNADIIFYNAGTDILYGDPIGCMGVSEKNVIKRDEMVFEFAFKNNIPICMVLSGGYSEKSHEVITRSIENLFKVFKLGEKKYLIN